MDGFTAVRVLANEKHAAAREADGGDGAAAALLAAAREIAGLHAQRLPPEHPLLGGGDGALHRSSRAIYLSNALGPTAAAFVEAHELGHYWVETPADPVVMLRDSPPGMPEENIPLGLGKVEAYSAQELRERCANVFAREFLLPLRAARRLFLDEGLPASAIARRLGAPLGLVRQQLAAALLIPRLPDDLDYEPRECRERPPAAKEKGGRLRLWLRRRTLRRRRAPQRPFAEDSPRARPSLDAFQKAAAEHEGSPLLVEAGPGTGKTQTLIARIEFLIGKGVPPSSILALTFSRKAAREIRERVALTMPAAAAEIWAGTFHAFGLEILRKFGPAEDAADALRFLDQDDAPAMLEGDLPLLDLRFLQSELRYIMRAISRAKDEVVSPDDYAAAAKRMAAEAQSEEDKRRAAESVEAARVYRHYEQRLRREGMIDFADLINRPIEILRSRPEARDELRGRYRHLLVDEYQDVNRAGALLLKELAGDGERLWAVGDARQSIYRFRGAAPANIRDFTKDYPRGRRKSLSVNYRSRKQIVDILGDYAATMGVSGGRSARLQAQRGPGGEAVDCHTAADAAAEAAGIAEAVERKRMQGVAWRDQAVLCRRHEDLKRIARGLEAAGVPVLYLGDLFARPEVRALLALIAFACEPGRGGGVDRAMLRRLAEHGPYGIPSADFRAFLDHAANKGKTPLEALSAADAAPRLSAEGRAGLRRLAEDLAGVDHETGPGELLGRVIFERRTWLHTQFAWDGEAGRQRRLAMHQFFQFAIENRGAGGGDPKRRFLDRSRRLASSRSAYALGELPPAAEEINAVRLMTVHAGKGLEFRVVHLPALAEGVFPLRMWEQRYPLPDGLLPRDPLDDHREEEECLFYVALSRARDHLSLSWARRYADRRREEASRALQAVAARLPRPPDGPPTWTR